MRDFGPCETSFHEQRRHSSLSQHHTLDRGACGKTIGELVHGLLVARPPFLAGDPCILYARHEHTSAQYVADGQMTVRT